MQMIVDTHAHVLPPSFYQMSEKGILPGVTFQHSPEKKPISFSINGAKGPYSPSFWDMEQRVRWLDENGINKQVICVSARLFFYDYDATEKFEIYRAFNDDLARITMDDPQHFIPMGTIPMQNVDKALEELQHLKHDLGFQTIQIGTSVCGKKLTDAEFVPIFQAIEQLGLAVMLHPVMEPTDFSLSQYNMENTIGNPIQLVIAVGNMLFSGFFDRFPSLRIILVHGGGYLPFQIGRLEHSYKIHGATKADCKHSPEYYIKNNIWFDGLTHSKRALKYLLETFGTNKVLFGTDHPFDMADYQQLTWMKECAYSLEDIQKVSSGNFYGLLR